jgi:hypothetical protein
MNSDACFCHNRAFICDSIFTSKTNYYLRKHYLNYTTLIEILLATELQYFILKLQNFNYTMNRNVYYILNTMAYVKLYNWGILNPFKKDPHLYTLSSLKDHI